MESQEYVLISFVHWGPERGYRKAGFHSSFSLFSPKSTGAASAGHPGHASHAQRHCHHSQSGLWGISFPQLSLQCTSTGGIRKRTSWQAFLGQGEGPFPWCWGVGELLRGSQAMQHVLQLSTYMVTSTSFPIPWQSRDLQMLPCDPRCCWLRDVMSSENQISALPPRQRQVQEKGKAKAQDTKALISAGPPQHLLGPCWTFLLSFQRCIVPNPLLGI